MTLSIPRILFTPHIQSYLDDHPRFDDVVISEPQLFARLEEREGGMKTMPEFEINSLLIEKPRIDFIRKKEADSTTLKWDASGSNDAIVITGLHNRKDNGLDLLIKKVSLDIFNFRFRDSKGKKFETGEGSVTAQLADVSIKEKQDGMDWQALVSRVNAADIVLDSMGKNKSRLAISRVALQDLGLSNTSITNLESLTKANSRFKISDFNGSITNDQSSLRWYGFSVSRTDKSFRMDSLTWIPALTADSFFAKSQLQKDHVQLRTGPISLSNADIESFMRDNTIVGSKLEIGGIDLVVSKDTRLPRDSGRLKPLPVNMLRQLGIPIQVDELNAVNGSVLYTEIAKDGKPVTIPITGITLEMRTLKNQDFDLNDSLHARISGMLLDSIRIQLELKQSYADDLAGMHIDAKFMPSRMQVLNAATVPLGKLYIKEGQLDSAILSVDANEFLAFGEMRMNYRDLKVQLLKDGEGLDNRNTKNFLSFLANTFVIRNNGKGKPAVIFLVRDRERSIFNYLVKIATRGFQTSIGVGKNKKLTRQYESELKSRGLPPLRN